MPDQPQHTRKLTIQAVAERLSVSPRTVWAWIAQGRIRPIRLGQRTTRISEEALEQFIDACREQQR